MEHESEKRFPACPKDYELYEEIGEGVSATVRRALCIPLNEIVAIKILDLEKCNNDLVSWTFYFSTLWWFMFHALINFSILLRSLLLVFMRFTA